MSETYLLELSQFQFPSVGIDQLTTHPYLAYVQDYKEKYSEYKFYRGFVNPSVHERAKIYRAIDLCCYYHNILMKDLIMFNSAEGLIIKCRRVSDEFTDNFNLYLSQEDNCVFVPSNCDKLDQYNYSHYRRMLNNFKNNEHIQCKIIRMNENNNVLLFLSSENSNLLPLDLKIKWKEYVESGVVRKCQVSSNKLYIALRVFSWIYRINFGLIPLISGELNQELIEFTVRSSSLSDFESRLQVISDSDPVEMKYIELDFTINDEYEAFGLLRNLGNHIVPLVGTSRIYFPEDTELDKGIIDNYKTEYELPDGCEIFTQDEFSEMSKWKQASLIKVPSGNLYSLLDLYRNPKKTDPYTREDFPKEFIEDMNSIMNELKGIFMTGFPPTTFKPELITIESGYDSIIQTISFYIRIGTITSVFWIIPDLRATEYSKTTFDAISILVRKWSDGSLFKNSFPYINVIPEWCDLYPVPEEGINYGDIHLVFSPIALYVFEQTINNLTVETYPRDIISQAQNLSNQSYILEKCS